MKTEMAFKQSNENFRNFSKKAQEEKNMEIKSYFSRVQTIDEFGFSAPIEEGMLIFSVPNESTYYAEMALIADCIYNNGQGKWEKK